MTPEQQLQQLLTEAEQVTAKMREALLHLPDYQPQPKLATTYDEVVEAVNPEWFCCSDGDIIETTIDHYQLPTEAAAKQDKAFIQIKNLEAYCAERFEGERDYIIDLDYNGKLFSMEYTYGIIKVTKESSEWLIANHSEPFLVFFGLK